MILFVLSFSASVLALHVCVIGGKHRIKRTSELSPVVFDSVHHCFIMQQQGSGVINYSTSKPSHAFTTNTTEFDDALLSRGIITMEQAMLAKGATSEEALRLVALKQAEEMKKKKKMDIHPISLHNKDSIKEWEEEDEHNNDDVQFIQSYRTQRLHELQTKSSPLPIIPSISRSEWTRCVNQASEDNWVLVFLTCSSSSSISTAFMESCMYMEQVLFPSLATQYSSFQMVQIPSHHAIPNWPEENLPTLFIYRFGILQHQLIGWKDFGYTTILKSSFSHHGREEEPLINKKIASSIMEETISRDDFHILFNHLEVVLSDFGVIQLSVEEKEEKQEVIRNRRDMAWEKRENQKRWGQFSGQIMGLKTSVHRETDDMANYDEVD